MEAICSSGKSVNFQRTTHRYIPEDSTLHNHRCENLKYNVYKSSLKFCVCGPTRVLGSIYGRAIAQAASRRLLPLRPGFDPRSGHVGFVVDKVALGQVFSEYFGFPCQSSFHQLLHNHHHLSSGAGTIGQQWPTYQVDSVSPHPEKQKKKAVFFYILSIGPIC
jgi:hypothetical protein